MTWDEYDNVIVFFYVISAVSSVVQGISGFGDAIILHLAWNIAVVLRPSLKDTIIGDHDVELIAILMSLRSVFLQSILSYWTRKGMSKPIFIRAMPAQCVCIVIGSALLTVLSDKFLKPFLGAVFLICAIIYILTKLRNYWLEKQRKELEAKEVPSVVLDTAAAQGKEQGEENGSPSAPQSSAKPKAAALPRHLDEDGNIHPAVLRAAILSGAFAGLGQGLAGVGGPAMMLFCLWFELPAQLVRGTFPLASFVAGLFRFAFTQYSGLYNWDAWLLYAVVVVGGVMGLFLGNMIGERINDFMFAVFVLSLLILACCVMLGVGPFIILGMIVVFAILGYFIYRWDSSRRMVAAKDAGGATTSTEGGNNEQEQDDKKSSRGQSISDPNEEEMKISFGS